MSWAEPDNGIDEVEENPDPEEDSDLPDRLRQNEDVDGREEEGPEDDCTVSGAEVGVEISNNSDVANPTTGTAEGRQGASVRDASENAGNAIAHISQDENEVRPSINPTPVEENSSDIHTEGDSFEQDEELAAPECENETLPEACSESDRQLFELQESHPIDLSTGDNSTELGAIETRGQSVTAGPMATVDDASASENVCEFSGNVEVSNNVEDAPEAEVGNIAQESRTCNFEDEANSAAEQARFDEAASIPISGMQHGLEEANMTSENIPDIPNDDESIDKMTTEGRDQDLQAPECDRETKHYSLMNENNHEHSGPTGATETVSVEQTSGGNGSGEAQSPLVHEPESTSCDNMQSASIAYHSSKDNSSEVGPTPASSSSPPAKVQNQRVDPTENVGDPGSQDTQRQMPGSHEQNESKSIMVHGSSGNSSDQSSNLDSVSSQVVDYGSAVKLSESDRYDSSRTLGSSNNQVPIQNCKPLPEKDKAMPSSQTTNAPTTSNTDSGRISLPASPAHGPVPHPDGAVASLGQSDGAHSIAHLSTPNFQSKSTSPTKTAASVFPSAANMGSETYESKLARALQSDDEDDILHELDAELLSRSTRNQSPQKSSGSPRSGPTRGREDLTQVMNGLQSSFDTRQLHEHNRQLLEQLRIRDNEIHKLKQEKEAQTAELALAKALADELKTKKSTSSVPNAEDLYLPQIKELEKTIAQQQNEIKCLKEKLMSHDSAAKRAVTTLQNELKSRVDQVTKMYEDCLKEKDMMVVKFAESEGKNMEAKRMTERSEAKMKEAMREKDNMLSALKAAKADKQKVVANFEAKCAEIANLHRELEKMKEAINSSEYRIKWFQNKLKDELEAHKETKGNLEKTNVKLKEAREETEVIRKECQAIVKRYQESEEIKSNSLDKELKMKETELRTQMQERNDTEEIHQMTKRELDSLKAQHKDTIEEAKTYKDKVRCLEEERQQNHKMIENYQEIMQRQKTDNAELKSKLASLSSLEEDYKRAQAMIQTLDKDIAELTSTNKDLQKDMESCRERESKMLTLQSELSRTNALLRSENTNLSNKASTLTGEVEQLKMEVQELETTVKDLRDKYEEEKIKRKEEVDKLNTDLSERTKECNDFKQKWEDEMDNTKTLKRRHANNIKDLTRQLHQVKKKLESLEGKGDAGSMGSRTNSNGSLNSLENSAAQQAPHQPPVQEFPVITEQVEVDKQVLIERIVRLQKSHARKNEKLEFLGEHIQQLLEEIKKKNKIIQVYALREEAGALSSDDMDANKEKVNQLYKAEAQKEMQILLARKGGIMASVYSVHQQDGNMTLELSLQINKKLQAVLEDTLLKNITLKENLDTLGEEIARLSQQNRQLQLHLQNLEH